MTTSRSTAPSPRISTFLAILLALLVIFPLLGHKPLTEWDEGIYAEISREMLSSGWLVPHLNHIAWLEKPPLMLWITAAFFKLFGVGELTARIGSALSGVAVVGLLHHWFAARRGLLAAWLGSFILLATLGFLHVCRVGEMDVLLSLGCMVSLIGLVQVDEHRSRGWLLFWAGFAVALMTKGAASGVLLLTAIVSALVQRWRLNRFGGTFWLGLCLFLLLTLPWHLVMLHLYGQRFVAAYLGLHVLARATGQIEGHSTHWWYYLKVLAVSAPPFVLLYPFAIANSLRRNRLRIFALFSLVVVLAFTLVQTRLPHYIAPAYPALAVVTASYLSDRLQPFLLERRPALFWTRLATAALVISIASILATGHARGSLHSTTLANGTVLPDNKEAITLLRAFPATQPFDGPLLVWHQGPIFVATDCFYSRRPVLRVLASPSTVAEAQLYVPPAEPLSVAVASGPRLILLDRDLVSQIPKGFAFTRIRSEDVLELGSIVRLR